MAWFVLIFSGMLEAVWALALDESDGLRRWRPTLIFLAALTLSMLGLSLAMKSIPTGTAYAVWAGIGATLTAAMGMISGKERATMMRILLLILLIGAVVGLKAVS